MAVPTYGQLSEFFAQAKAGRVTLENFQAYLRDPNRFVEPRVYTVTIDYGKTLAEMIAAGHYDCVNTNITPANFPISGIGVVECVLELIHFNKVVTTTEVLKHFEDQGMRPATLPELLALGAAYSELQREFPLVAFGSVWAHPDGDRRVPDLVRSGSKRYLNLEWLEGGNAWDESCRFVSVRK